MSRPTIDYTAAARAIVGVVEAGKAVPPATDAERALLEASQLGALQRMEDTHAGALVARGVSPEAARASAASFMAQVIAKHRYVESMLQDD